MAMYIPFLHRGRIATALTALVPCAGGLIVLLGWTFDIERLKRIFLALVAMNPTAAVCFLFLGCAVLGSQAPAEERTLRRIAAFCAAAAGAYATASTSQRKPRQLIRRPPPSARNRL